jgi:AcrR family transcriptional regulator
MVDSTPRLSKARRPISDNEQAGGAAHVASKAARRTQEARTREAREKLLKATIEVLLERGYSKLSTREVASRAGLSNGALVHHFSSKSELVVAATAAVYDEAVLRARRGAESPKVRKDPITGFISHCASVYFDWPFIAALEVVMVARTDPELMSQIQPVIQHYRTLTDEAWIEAIKSTGVTRSKSERILAMTLNAVRGMALDDLWGADPTRHKKALVELTSFAKKTLMQIKN